MYNFYSKANSSPKIFSNRCRLNSGNYISSNSTTSLPHDEEGDLKDAPWFQAGISRDIAFEILSSKSPGAFLVRKSTSKPGCYALTLRVPSTSVTAPKVSNYIILRSGRGFKIKVSTQF